MACRGLLVFQMVPYSRDEWDDYRHPISARDGDGKLFLVGGGGEEKNQFIVMTISYHPLRYCWNVGAWELYKAAFLLLRSVTDLLHVGLEFSLQNQRTRKLRTCVLSPESANKDT